MAHMYGQPRMPRQLAWNAMQQLDLDWYNMSEEELEALDEQVIEEMDECMRFADESPQPDPEHRFENVLIEHGGEA